MKMFPGVSALRTALAFTLASVASTPSAQAKGSEFLSAGQKKIALKSIDSICADTWCGGDFDFEFLSIECSTEDKRCDVSFNMKGFLQLGARDSEDYAFFKHAAGCSLRGFTQFSDLVQAGSLEDRFYEKLTTCIERLEKQFKY